MGLPAARVLPKPTEVILTVRHLAGTLLRSRLLLAYVVMGVLSGLAMGPAGLPRALVNYFVLLPVYVLIIHIWTQRDATVAEERAAAEPAGGRAGARRRDLALVAVLYAVNIAGIAWFWAGGAPMELYRSTLAALLDAGWDREVAGRMANAASSIAVSLLPALVVVFLFGLRPRQVGLVPRRLGLGLCLVLVGIALAGISQLATSQSTPLWLGLGMVPLALAIFAVHIFINGLPEEFVFRGVMLSRLLPWLRNPHHALVLTSILFVASHIPSHLARPTGAPLWLIIGGSLTSPGPQPTGLIWGYLYYRTRSIWPGVLWHTSFTTLGMLFL